MKRSIRQDIALLQLTDSCCWVLHASAAEGKEGYQNVMRVSCVYNGYKGRQLS